LELLGKGGQRRPPRRVPCRAGIDPQAARRPGRCSVRQTRQRFRRGRAGSGGSTLPGGATVAGPPRLVVVGRPLPRRAPTPAPARGAGEGWCCGGAAAGGAGAGRDQRARRRSVRAVGLLRHGVLLVRCGPVRSGCLWKDFPSPGVRRRSVRRISAIHQHAGAAAGIYWAVRFLAIVT